MTHLNSYNNIFEIEILYFWGNMKVLVGHLYTRWTSKGVDIIRQLTEGMIARDIIFSFCIFS